MNVGVGLPSSVPGRAPGLVVAWAEKADAGPFTSLGVVDRVAYDALEPLTTLAAAAAATTRIGLVTMIVISPLRSTSLLAKQAASVDALSDGRLTLGVAVGARSEDYLAAGMDPGGRGPRLAEQLVALKEHFEEGATGPRVRDGGVPILVGGGGDLAFARAARHADGYVHGGGPPRTFERAAGTIHAAWADAERPGRPRLWAQSYFALGPDARDRGMAYMRDYYAFTGPFAERIAEGLLTTPQKVVQQVQGYRAAGCEELVLLPAVPDLDQLDRLSDAMTGA